MRTQLSASADSGQRLALFGPVCGRTNRWRFITLLTSLVLVGIYLLCRSWSLHYRSGTWTYLGYVERLLTRGYPPGHIWYADLSTEWPTFSVWYLFLAELVRTTGIASVDLWMLLPVLLIPLGFGWQFLWMRSLTRNNVAALLGACASFWLTDVWMLVSGPITRFVAFYVFTPLALLCLYRAFREPSSLWSWAVAGGLFYGLTTQVATLFALQLGMLLFCFLICLFIFRARSLIAEIRALMVFVLVGGVVGGYRLLTLFFDPGRALPLNSFYSNAAFWNTTVGPIEILNPGRYLGVLSPFYYGIAFLLMGVSWIAMLRQWRSKRYLVAWISSLWLLCGLVYLTPLGALLGRAITPGVVSEIFLASNLLPFGLALGVAVVELANIIVHTIRRACERFGLAALAGSLAATGCILAALSLFALSSVAPLRFYWGLMRTTPVTAEDFVGPLVVQYLQQETHEDAVILSDPWTGHVLPALTHRKVMIANRNFMGHSYDQRLTDAGRVMNPNTSADESLAILRRYDVEFILLNPRFWNSARDRRVEQYKYGFDFPDDMSAVAQKFESDSRFGLEKFDDGTMLFKLAAE